MQFADRVLVGLSEEATRFRIFGEAALRNIVKASYGLEDAALQGAAAAQFDFFALGGLDADHEMPRGEEAARELRVDALWRGAVRLSASFPAAEITAVSAAPIGLDGLDAAVAAGNGGVLPAGDMLEAARRAELGARLRSAASDAEAAPPSTIDAWLSRAGAASVGDLLATQGNSAAAHLQLTFTQRGGEGFSDIDFPVAVAAMIRDPADPGTRLTGLVAAARRVQAAIRRAGFEPKRAPERAGPGRTVVALVVPEGWFDDEDWPGADRDARAAAAGAWMAREGIALVPVGA